MYIYLRRAFDEIFVQLFVCVTRVPIFDSAQTYLVLCDISTVRVSSTQYRSTIYGLNTPSFTFFRLGFATLYNMEIESIIVTTTTATIVSK